MTEIIKASDAEISDVLELIEEYYRAVDVVVRDTPQQVRESLAQTNGGTWLAYQDRVPAGCVVLRPLPQREHGAECKRLYVRPVARGMGVADRLLDAMEAHARSLGFRWIYLDSKDDLRDAIRLYRRRGYMECERYNSNPQATVFLRKDLQPHASAG